MNQTKTNHSTQKFDPLEIAQEILDYNKTLIWKDGRLGVHEWGKYRLYGVKESALILNEFMDMSNIAKRCSSFTDPIRHKLEAILGTCK